ncbi:MAG: hypothetical protein JNK26_01520 [Candidatus Doudnabacteria bacterium]|nr:hypothetical protein [Candidatus Doudnabacteria bacterium]
MDTDTKVVIDPRHTARAMALQKLFWELTEQGSEPLTEEYLLENLEATEYDIELYKKIVSGVKDNQAYLDKLIEEY